MRTPLRILALAIAMSALLGGCATATSVHVGARRPMTLEGDNASLALSYAVGRMEQLSGDPDPLLVIRIGSATIQRRRDGQAALLLHSGEQMALLRPSGQAVFVQQHNRLPLVAAVLGLALFIAEVADELPPALAAVIDAAPSAQRADAIELSTELLLHEHLPLSGTIGSTGQVRGSFALTDEGREMLLAALQRSGERPYVIVEAGDSADPAPPDPAGRIGG